MKSLDEIAIMHGTDKATQHPVGAHGYAPFYDQHFWQMRDGKINMLEIGVGGGESIRTWLEYFPFAKIFGVDVVHDTNPYNTAPSTVPRYTFNQGDQSCPVFWACFLADHGKSWDIIIDDGGHYDKQITTSFAALWPHVTRGGLYCIEDLACAYSSIFLTGVTNPMDMLKREVDRLHQGASDIAEIHFSRELAILRKS